MVFKTADVLSTFLFTSKWSIYYVFDFKDGEIFNSPVFFRVWMVTDYSDIFEPILMIPFLYRYGMARQHI